MFSAVLDNMTSMYEFLLKFFYSILQVVVENPLLYIPVVISILAGAIFFAIKLLHRFGVRSSFGKRRGRR